MGTLWQDMRYGARMLAKRPGFTLVAVAALALGIGANTAIFSVVNGVLLRPLPFEGAERLVVVESRNELTGGLSEDHSYPNLTDLHEQATTLEGVAAYSRSTTFLTTGDEAERIRGVLTTANLFPLLGARAAQGRTLTAEDDRKDAPRVILLSHNLWRGRFGADPSIVGKEIPVGGTRARPATVVGVMPEGFKYPVEGSETDFWMPLVPILADSDLQRGSVWLTGVGRLREGVTLDAANAELAAVSRRLEAEYQDSNRDRTFTLAPLHQKMVGDLSTALWVLLGAVGCVLLIACANVANLLLARAASRRREMSIRTALGAGRWRIVRQLLTESVMLALAGGALGLLLAWWGVDVLVAAAPADVPRGAEVALDARALLFTVGLSVLTGLIFGLAPAISASRADIAGALKEGGRTGAEGGRSRLRGALVVAEVALSLVLLVGAGLLAQSFLRLLDVSPGFDPSNMLTADVVFRGERYAQRTQSSAALDEILERAKGAPGVIAAGAGTPLPLGGGFEAFDFQIEGRPPAEPGRVPSADRRQVSTDYFRAMGIPLKSGRLFEPRDTAGSQPVAVINETFARQFFPGEDPMGQRITFSGERSETPVVREVVGVAGDVRHAGLDAEAGPEYYVPFAQLPAPRVTIVARTNSGDPTTAAPILREAIRQVDQNIALFNVRTMDSLLSQSVARRRFNMALLGGFALVALLLAGLGIYGVMSYTVAQRTHEIGVRIALGARGADVLGLVLRQGMALTLAGVGLGLVAALALSRLLASLLYGVTATDPLTFAGVAMLLTAVAFVSCYLPARRATRVDPMEALRYE